MNIKIRLERLERNVKAQISDDGLPLVTRYLRSLPDEELRRLHEKAMAEAAATPEHQAFLESLRGKSDEELLAMYRDAIRRSHALRE